MGATWELWGSDADHVIAPLPGSGPDWGPLLHAAPAPLSLTLMHV